MYDASEQLYQIAVASRLGQDVGDSAERERFVENDPIDISPVLRQRVYPSGRYTSALRCNIKLNSTEHQHNKREICHCRQHASVVVCRCAMNCNFHPDRIVRHYCLLHEHLPDSGTLSIR